MIIGNLDLQIVCFVLQRNVFRFFIFQFFLCRAKCLRERFGFSLFNRKRFCKRSVFLRQRNVLRSKLDIFLLFRAVKCFHGCQLFIQSLDLIIQLFVFIFKVFDFILKLIYLVLQLIDRGDVFENRFLQEIGFLKPFCPLLFQCSRVFLFGCQCRFRIFVIFLCLCKRRGQGCTVCLLGFESGLLISHRLLKLCDLFVKRIRFSVPNLSSLFLRCNDLF